MSFSTAKNDYITALGPDEEMVQSHDLVIDKTFNFIAYLRQQGVALPLNAEHRLKFLPKAAVFGTLCHWIKTLQGSSGILSKIVAARDLTQLVNLLKANEKLVAEFQGDDDVKFLLNSNTFDTWRPGQSDKFWKYLDMYIELCSPQQIFSYKELNDDE